MGTKGKLSIRACTAAVACAFATGAAAQSPGAPFDQIQVGLERAVRQPMEIVWLQSQIQADMWKTPGLAQSLEGSSLLVWSFGSFKAPFVKPRLNLASGKRLLMVSGDTAELIDGRYPNIHIELPVRPGQSLLEGLAASDISKVFSALVQGAGRTQAEPFQVAALGASAVAKRPDPLITHIAKVVEAECTIPEVATPLPEKKEPPIAVASIDLSALVGRVEIPRIEAIAVPELAMPAVMVEVAEARPFELIVPAVTVEVAQALPFAFASVDLSFISGRLDVPLQELAVPAPEMHFAPVAVEVAQALPFAVASVDLSAISGRLDVPLQELAAPAMVFAPVALEVAHAASSAEMVYAAVVLETAQALPPKPVQVAVAAPKPVSADIAKMRAEIEAEVAKENERFAQMIKGGATGKQFRFGT